MAADGRIVIDTAINTKGFKAGAKEVEDAAKRAADTITDIGKTAQDSVNSAVEVINSQAEAFEKVDQQIETVKEHMDEVNASAGSTDGFEKTNQALNTTGERAHNAAQAVRQLEQKSGDASKAAWAAFREQNAIFEEQQAAAAEVQKQLDAQSKTGEKTQEYVALEQEIDKLSAKMDALVEKQIRFVEIGGDQKSKTFKGMEYDIEQLRAKLEGLQAQKMALESSGGAYTSAAPVDIGAQVTATQQTNSFSAALATLKARIVEYAQSSGVANSAQLLLSRSANAAKAAVSGIWSGAQRVATGFKNAASAVKDYITKSRKVGSSAGIGAKGMATMALGVSSLLGAFMKLRQGLTEGLKNLSKFDKGTNTAMSSLSSSLTQVKNSLATAFSPILTAIAPAINSLLGMISRALNAIGEFMAALTGQSTYTRATAVQEDYAASLDGTAAAAKNAQKQMSGLDEMTTWQSKESGGSGSGSGSGSKAFETVDIKNSPFANFAEQIKDLIAAQDFRGVGDAVAQKLNVAISSWDGAGAGKSLSDGIKNALDTALGFLQGTNWQGMGQQVANFITAIDWSGIVSRLYEGVGSALGALAGFLWGLVQGAWESVVGWWNEVAFEDGQFTIQGLLNGIWEGIKNIGKWIYDHIFKPFIDGFCKAFGINSPSTVMLEMGGYIVQGLVNAIKSIPQKVGEFFTNAKNKAVSAFNTLKTNITTKATEIYNSVVTWIKNIPTKIGEFFTNAKSKAVSAFNALKTGASNALKTLTSWIAGAFKTDWTKKLGALGNPINALLTNIQNIWNGIKGVFNGITTFVSGVFTGNWKKAWEGVKKIFSSVLDTFVSYAKAPINGIIGLINGLVDALNTAIAGINKIKVNIPSWVPLVGGKSIGFNIPKLSKIPYLASGAVIPPNAPFTAMLGDQRHGTNLEAPESLIRQIVREESGSGVHTFIAQINRRTIFKEIIDEGKLQQARTGKNPFVLA